jgi:Lon protease-like protein
METNLDLRLPVFVLEDAVLLPGAVVRLETGAAGAARASELARSDEKRVVVALSAEGELGVHPIATLARVEGVGRDGGVIVAGLGRVRVLGMEEGEPLPTARVEEVAVPAASQTT